MRLLQAFLFVHILIRDQATTSCQFPLRKYSIWWTIQCRQKPNFKIQKLSYYKIFHTWPLARSAVWHVTKFGFFLIWDANAYPCFIWISRCGLVSFSNNFNCIFEKLFCPKISWLTGRLKFIPTPYMSLVQSARYIFKLLMIIWMFFTDHIYLLPTPSNSSDLYYFSCTYNDISDDAYNMVIKIF